MPCNDRREMRWRRGLLLSSFSRSFNAPSWKSRWAVKKDDLGQPIVSEANESNRFIRRKLSQKIDCDSCGWHRIIFLMFRSNRISFHHPVAANCFPTLTLLPIWPNIICRTSRWPHWLYPRANIDVRIIISLAQDNRQAESPEYWYLTIAPFDAYISGIWNATAQYIPFWESGSLWRRLKAWSHHMLRDCDQFSRSSVILHLVPSRHRAQTVYYTVCSY